MSALAEALVAAQRRAVAQLEKEYVRSVQEDADERAAGFRDALAAIGLTDRTDADALVNCLEVLRVTGGALPAETRGNGEPKPPERASEAQVRLIQKMLREREQTPLAEQDLRNLAKPRASALIDAIQAGTYDPVEWDVPI